MSVEQATWTEDALIKLLGGDSGDVLGTILLVYTEGGTGPEKIMGHLFTDGSVPRLPEKLRAMADYFEVKGPKSHG